MSSSRDAGDSMDLCPCCQSLVQQLEEHFRKGDDDQFHQVWSAVVKSEVEDDPDIMDLSLIVRFKLKVYFTIIVQKEMKQKDSKMTDERKERLARFLHEDGTRYSKFPELAPYFALPYIKESNHPIIADIQSDDWINVLHHQWIQLLKMSIHHYHGFDEKKLEKKFKSHSRLKNKHVQLRSDHKMLLDLATKLVTALEDSLRGEMSCDLETFECYNQEIKNLSDSLEENKQDGTFQWEAPLLKKSPSTESIDSKTWLE